MENSSILRSQINLCSTDKDTSRTANFIINKRMFCNALPKRHVLALYGFFGFFFAYSLRANLSVAIVQMSTYDFDDTKDPVHANSTNQTVYCRNRRIRPVNLFLPKSHEFPCFAERVEVVVCITRLHIVIVFLWIHCDTIASWYMFI
jgi:hypothetical protein